MTGPVEPASRAPWGEPIDLGRSLTAERVAAHLQSQITLGELAGGTSLREVELAAAFDVSRNTIREAFRVLERERLIVHRAHRGVMVRTLHSDELTDLYRFRTILELEGIRHAEPGRIAPLGAAVAAAEAVADRGDERLTLTEDLRLHQAIVDLAGSPRMSATFAGLLAELRLGLSSMESQAAGHWLSENRRIVALLHDGDRRAAAGGLRAYLQESEAVLREHLMRAEGPR